MPKVHTGSVRVREKTVAIYNGALVTAVQNRRSISLYPHKMANNPHYPTPEWRITHDLPERPYRIKMQGTIRVSQKVESYDYMDSYLRQGYVWCSPITLIETAEWYFKFDFSKELMREAWICLEMALTMAARHTMQLPDSVISAVRKADKCKQLADREGTKAEGKTAMVHAIRLIDRAVREIVTVIKEEDTYRRDPSEINLKNWPGPPNTWRKSP